MTVTGEKYAYTCNISQHRNETVSRSMSLISYYSHRERRGREQTERRTPCEKKSRKGSKT
jgi:hypothetical protein